jgi:hypothetical protein
MGMAALRALASGSTKGLATARPYNSASATGKESGSAIGTTIWGWHQRRFEGRLVKLPDAFWDGDLVLWKPRFQGLAISSQNLLLLRHGGAFIRAHFSGYCSRVGQIGEWLPLRNDDPSKVWELLA